ncbi:hypothetical protein V9L20_11410 [Variovorax sp. CCNWLW225]|uniref:hypothetical protein n=1 Tax=Variovorax sp. CCNWLW225 TaxID=3127462 RepID=UPI003076A050
MACALHNKNGQDLEIEIPPGAQLQLAGVQGASVSQGELRFATLGDRNRAVAAHVLAELGERRSDSDTLWNAARALWRKEIGHADLASGRLLAAAHTDQDLLRTAACRMTSASEVFEVLHLVKAALPHLDDLDLDALINLCDVEQPLTQGDMAAGIFYGDLQRWLATRPATAHALVEKILDTPAQTRGNLLGAAWMAWFGIDPQAAASELLAVCTRVEAPVPSVTCWIAGRMLAELPNEPVPATRLEDLILRRISSADAQEHRAGLAAATSLLHLRRRFDGALRKQIDSGDAEARAYVARALSREAEAFLVADVFFEWLQRCVALDETFAGVLSELDYTLSTLLRPGSQHIDGVFGFFEGWVAAQPQAKGGRDGRFAEQFDQCANKILEQPHLSARMVTQWMLRDGLAFPSATAGVISRVDHRRGGSSLRFDPALLVTATESDLRFLGKRVLGFLIEVDHMLSLALSLLDVTDAKNRVHPMMRWLLLQEIGYDYPSTTAKQLRIHAGRTVDPETTTLLLDIAAELDAHLADLDDLPRLRELALPRAVRREFRKARAKQMENSMREGRKDSALAQLMSTVHIKAGESSFQYVQDEFSQPMHFTSHSISVELPRRESLDPVGNAYRMHTLRVAKRGGA